MAIEDRLGTLEDRRQALDEIIRAEAARPGSSDFHVATLKRQKLALKDEIATMRRSG